MDIYNFINNRLIEKGFESINSPEIEDLGAITYKSNINQVVLKKIHILSEVQDIRAFSIKIRNIMINENVNINNTYLLFCTNEKVDYETFFKIERDTSALRKYVIRNEKDLNRIPFLDNLIENANVSINVKREQEDDFYLLKIFDLLRTYSGQHNKLSKEQIDTSVKKIIDLVEEKYEH